MQPAQLLLNAHTAVSCTMKSSPKEHVERNKQTHKKCFAFNQSPVHLFPLPLWPAICISFALFNTLLAERTQVASANHRWR